MRPCLLPAARYLVPFIERSICAAKETRRGRRKRERERERERDVRVVAPGERVDCLFVGSSRARTNKWKQIISRPHYEKKSIAAREDSACALSGWFSLSLSVSFSFRLAVCPRAAVTRRTSAARPVINAGLGPIPHTRLSPSAPPSGSPFLDLAYTYLRCRSRDLGNSCRIRIQVPSIVIRLHSFFLLEGAPSLDKHFDPRRIPDAFVPLCIGGFASHGLQQSRGSCRSV